MEKPVSGSAEINSQAPRASGFYAWAMVIVAAIFMAATLPGRTHGLGLITKRLIEDLDASRLDFAQLNLWATLIGALFCIPCGWLIDRIGLRRISLAVVVGLAVVVVQLGRTTSLTEVAILVTLTRGLGQSMLSVISITLIGKCFSRQLPIAMAVYSVLLSLLMAAATGWLGQQIIALGWRAAWQMQGWILLATTVPCACMIRDNRSVSRVAAEHDPPTTAAEAEPATLSSVATHSSATLSQALLSPCFWLFAISISFFGLISSGLSLFNQYVLAERGFAESVYHTTLVVGLLAGLVGNLAAGALAKRWPLQSLLAIALFGLAISLAVFPWVTSYGHVLAYAILMGISGGMLTVLFFTVWKYAFGQLHLGIIQGSAQMITVLASAVGPVLVSISQAHTGSYTTVFIFASVAAACFGFAACLTTVPHAASGHWDRVAEPSIEYREPEPCPTNL